jgi:hypothetical protein
VEFFLITYFFVIISTPFSKRSTDYVTSLHSSGTIP